MKLILGDARDHLAETHDANVLITDPPYGLSGARGRNVRRGKAVYDSDFEDTPEYVGDVVVPIIRYILQHVERAAITPGNRCTCMYPQPDDVGAFFHPAAVAVGPWGYTTSQPIFFYGKDPRAGKGPLPSGIRVTEKADKNGHPCPKPLHAWQWLVGKVAHAGDVVVDPFMGAGTTGVCCRRIGADFIGIELSPTYHRIACAAINGDVDTEDPQSLFFGMMESSGK